MGSGQTKVLLVDPDSLERMQIRDGLIRLDYFVIEAANPDGAWYRLERYSPDVILMETILDMELGYMFCDTLRKEELNRRRKDGDLSSIAIIGMGDGEIYEGRWLSAGANAFLEKREIYREGRINTNILEETITRALTEIRKSHSRSQGQPFEPYQTIE